MWIINFKLSIRLYVVILWHLCMERNCVIQKSKFAHFTVILLCFNNNEKIYNKVLIKFGKDSGRPNFSS
jgi:hypothetical protein